MLRWAVAGPCPKGHVEAPSEAQCGRSSTLDEDNPNNAWNLNFNSGNVNTNNNNRNNGHSVLPVRSN